MDSSFGDSGFGGTPDIGPSSPEPVNVVGDVTNPAIGEDVPDGDNPDVATPIPAVVAGYGTDSVLPGTTGIATGSAATPADDALRKGLADSARVLGQLVGVSEGVAMGMHQQALADRRGAAAPVTTPKKEEEREPKSSAMKRTAVALTLAAAAAAGAWVATDGLEHFPNSPAPTKQR